MKRKAYLLILLCILTCIIGNNETHPKHSVIVENMDYKADNNSGSYEIQQVKFLTVSVQVQGDFDENIKSSPITCKCHVTRMTRIIYMDGTDELGTKSVVYKEKVGELMKPTKFGYTFVNWIDKNNQVVDNNSIINSTVDYPIYANYNIIVSQLSIDPNGGVWSGGTGTQEFSMNYNTEKEIEDPTRVGYTFKGWEITGEASTITGNKFKMGVENSTLKAKWEANTYQINVNPDGGTYNGSTSITKVPAKYEQETTISIPTRTGYTFTGWIIDKGDLRSDTKIYLNHPGDINIKATWRINSYHYIVYHKKQNSTGTAYSTAETDAGTGVFGTVINPNVKTYTGFNSPAQGSITIQEDSDPPVKNILNYNYARKQFTLTVNANGGSYSGSSSVSLYYEQTLTIPVPTRTGYTFTGWTKSSSDSNITDNVFTMKLTNTTLTANWSANSYVVTYNVNGGNAISPSTRNITYGTTYGSLPTPTRTGYKFNGWYTAASGGTKVNASDTYNKAQNTTLYAQWTNNKPVIGTTSISYANNPGGTNGILTSGREVATIVSEVSDAEDGMPSVEMSCTSGSICSSVSISKTLGTNKATFTVTATAMGVGTLQIRATDKAGSVTTYTIILYVYGSGSSLTKDGTFTDNTYDSGFTTPLEACYISHYTFKIQLKSHSNSSSSDPDKIIIYGLTSGGQQVTLYTRTGNIGSSLLTITDEGLSGYNTNASNFIVRMRFTVYVPTSHRSCVNNSSNILNYSLTYAFSPLLMT